MATRNRQWHLSYSQSRMVAVMVLILNSRLNQFTLYLLKTVRVLVVILNDEQVVWTLKTDTHTHAVTNSWLDSRPECVRYQNAGRLLLADCWGVAALARLPYRQAQPRLCTTPPSLIHPLIPSGSQPKWEWQLNHRHHSKYLTPTWRTVLFLSLELLLSSIYCPLITPESPNLYWHGMIQ